MPKQRFGLGRGLDALIPGATTVSEDVPLDTTLANSALPEVPTAMISPNPRQPRTSLTDDPQLDGLVKSILEFGLLQPLLVRLDGEDEEGSHYQLIAGERRWRAAQIAGLAMVPVIIYEAATPELMLELALVENLQRTDLNPLDEAQGYQTLIEEYHLTQEQVAERVGRSRTTVTNTLRLLQLPEEVRRAIINFPMLFTEGHARAVLQVAGEEERITLKNEIIAQMLSVRQAEERARQINQRALGPMADKRGGLVHQQSYDTRRLQEEFMRAMEMKVKLQRSSRGKGGSLTLYFSNDDQFQRLHEKLVSEGHDGFAAPLLGDDGDNHRLDIFVGRE